MSRLRQELDEIDRREEEYMYNRPLKDRGTPYQPIGPPEPVRQGATWEGASEFIERAEEACRRQA